MGGNSMNKMTKLIYKIETLITKNLNLSLSEILSESDCYYKQRISFNGDFKFTRYVHEKTVYYIQFYFYIN